VFASFCRATVQSGFTALHVAARYGNHRVAGLLMEYGADANFVAKVNICMRLFYINKRFRQKPVFVAATSHRLLLLSGNCE